MGGWADSCVEADDERESDMCVRVDVCEQCRAGGRAVPAARWSEEARGAPRRLIRGLPEFGIRCASETD